MTDFIRRLVSGDKARYTDGDLDIDLDLVYITDRVIVMGYPAAGIEGLYRNRREDTKRFLEHRHGKNFWVFNFCPVKENSYPSSVFDGRVSRYPFPDHYAPPLAMLTLVAREIRAWLEGSAERVAVLHCKAGKGRSGTMACSYLLTLESSPEVKGQQDSKLKALATLRAEKVMNAMPADEQLSEESSVEDIATGEDPIKQELANTSTVDVQGRDKINDSVAQVLALHTSRRMKQQPSSKNVKQGVSIPSQRRWLYYWSLLLAQQGPSGFWSINEETQSRRTPKVRLTQITLRMRELSGIKMNLMRIANAILDRTSATTRAAAMSGGTAQMWASLARYDDELVGLLEDWEKHTRDENGNMGKHRASAERRGMEEFAEVFKSKEWDKVKMVRSFACLGALGGGVIQNEEARTGTKVVTHLLQPLTNDSWGQLRDEIEESPGNAPAANSELDAEETSLYDVTQSPKSDGGIILNAHREVRVKLCMGQVYMGWFWFIPTFHMPHPRSAGRSGQMLLTRKEIDFPLGIGSSIVEVVLSMEWCPETTEAVDMPPPQVSFHIDGGQGEPVGVAVTLQALAAGDVEDLVSVKQAAED